MIALTRQDTTIALTRQDTMIALTRQDTMIALTRQDAMIALTPVQCGWADAYLQITHKIAEFATLARATASRMQGVRAGFAMLCRGIVSRGQGGPMGTRITPSA